MKKDMDAMEISPKQYYLLCSDFCYKNNILLMVVFYNR